MKVLFKFHDPRRADRLIDNVRLISVTGWAMTIEPTPAEPISATLGQIKAIIIEGEECI